MDVIRSQGLGLLCETDARPSSICGVGVVSTKALTIEVDLHNLSGCLAQVRLLDSFLFYLSSPSILYLFMQP